MDCNIDNLIKELQAIRNEYGNLITIALLERKQTLEISGMAVLQKVDKLILCINVVNL